MGGLFLAVTRNLLVFLVREIAGLDLIRFPLYYLPFSIDLIKFFVLFGLGAVDVSIDFC